MWIGLADLLLCILSVVIVAVALTKAKVDGVDLWLVGPEKWIARGRLRIARSR
jgi:hypothetical protein